MLIFNVKLCNVLYVVIKPCQGVGEGLLQFVEVVCFVLILIVESFALSLVGCCALKAFEVWVIQDPVDSFSCVAKAYCDSNCCFHVAVLLKY